MSSTTINLHRITQITARHQVGTAGVRWVVFQFIDEDDGKVEITAFMEEEKIALAYANAISSVNIDTTLGEDVE